MTSIDATIQGRHVILWDGDLVLAELDEDAATDLTNRLLHILSELRWAE